jgi:antitoxin YefM
MYSTYRLKADELSNNFLKSIKKAYEHQEIEIIIHEVEDETEYLMKNPANKKNLLDAINNIESNSNVIELKTEDL